MKNIILYIILFLSFSFVSLSGQTQIQGKVTDKSRGEPIVVCTVALYGGGALITGTDTDFDGNYFFSDIEPGIYDIEVSYVGYKNTTVKDVIAKAGKITQVDIQVSEGETMEEVVIVGSKVPLVEFDCVTSGATLTSEDIEALPTKSISSIAATAGDVSVNADGDISVRSGRGNATHYYIDGIRVDAKTAKRAKTIKKAKRAAKKAKRKKSKSEKRSSLKRDVLKGKTTGVTIGEDKEILIRGYSSDAGVEEVEPISYDNKINLPSSGQLTAAEWNDLNNWNDWNELTEEDGVYQSMTEYWGIELGERFAVFVTNESNVPVPNCEVFLEDKHGEILWSAISDNAGRAELWAQDSSVEQVGSIRVKQEGQEKVYRYPKTSEEGSNHIVINAQCKSSNKVDIMFVVDVTSSMSDELNFLRAELKDVIEQSTSTLDETVEIRLGSVFYKDHTDDYLTQVTPLDSDIDKTMNFVSSKRAGGGGDTPEAVDAGLAAALDQDWDMEAVSRLLFLVLDAPPHHNDEVLSRLSQQIYKAAELGVKIIPITASGIDRETEYLMKSMSITTNGTYVFLTDDSGIGNPHLKPVVSDYDVELLNDLLVRLISNYSLQEECLNITSATIENFEIYPNPTTTSITVNYKGDIDEFLVTSSTGKRITLISNVISGAKLDLSDLVSGIYQVSLRVDGVIIDTQSVIKI